MRVWDAGGLDEESLQAMELQAWSRLEHWISKIIGWRVTEPCHSTPSTPSLSMTVSGCRLFKRPTLAIGIRIPWSSSPDRYFLANEKGVVVADTCRCLSHG